MPLFLRIVGVTVGGLGLLAFVILVTEAQPEGRFDDTVNTTLVIYGVVAAVSGVLWGTIWFALGDVVEKVREIADKLEEDQ